MFNTELMTCCQCNFKQQADPLIQSGWAALVVEGKKSYICPACCAGDYEPSAIKCKTCDKYYDSDYSSCPHCEKISIIERLKDYIINSLNDAEKDNRYPVFVIKEDLLQEGTLAANELKAEFEKRGVFPIFKVLDKEVIIGGYIDLLTQNTMMAQILANQDKTTLKEKTKWVIAKAKNLLHDLSEEHLKAMSRDYLSLVDEVNEAEKQFNEDQK